MKIYRFPPVLGTPICVQGTNFTTCLHSSSQPSSMKWGTRWRTCRATWPRPRSCTMRRGWTGCSRRTGPWSWGARSWRSSSSRGKRLKVFWKCCRSSGMVTVLDCKKRWRRTHSTSRALAPSLTSWGLTLGDFRRPSTRLRTLRWLVVKKRHRM